MAIFTFNVGGYYLLFWTLRKHADRELSIRFDSNEYPQEETIELKIPVSLNFPLQEQGYQRVNGTVAYQNHYYKLIKQKLENDTLYIVCIPDQREKVLAQAMQDYIELVTEAPSTSKRSAGLINALLKDFTVVSAHSRIFLAGWVRTIEFPDFQPGLLTGQVKIIGPPPKG